MKARTWSLILLGVGLAWLLMATVFTGSSGAKISPITRDFITLNASLKSYRNHTGRYPTTGQGLAALIARPNTGPQSEKWLQILKKVPMDPWGKEYRYQLLSDGKDPKPSSSAPDDFELRSAGKDGRFGTEDDISSVDD